jgi:hypothetical protein
MTTCNESYWACGATNAIRTIVTKLGFAGPAEQRFILFVRPVAPSWMLAACFAIGAAYRFQLQVHGRP